MREIKFRTWQGGKFNYWGFVVSKYSDDYEFRGIADTNTEPLTMAQKLDRTQQFTGLKDRNGKEIYEGDIIVLSDQHITDSRDCGKRLIEWQNGNFRWVDLNIREELSGWTYGENTAEKYAVVIGNIYENPELIEVDNEEKSAA